MILIFLVLKISFVFEVFFAFGVLVRSNLSNELNIGESPVFEIGGLFPEINEAEFPENLKIYENYFENSTEFSPISNTIHLASRKLSDIFYEDYRCHLKLVSARTKVKF